MTAPRDYAVVYRLGGPLLLHRADCGYARWAAEEDGAPVLTLMDCETDPGPFTPRAACLRGGVCAIPEETTTKEKEEKTS